MGSIGERLKIVRGKKSQADFAAEIGVSRNTLLRYERGESVPDARLAAVICRKAAVASDWLLLGEGPMERNAEGNRTVCTPKSAAENPDNPDVPILETPDPDNYNWIPMVEAELSAGGGSFIASESIKDYYAFRKPFIANIASAAANLVLMRVTGESMDPEIRNGATVMIDLGRKRIKNHCIFAIHLADTIIIKELEHLPGGRIRVISKNRAEYPPYETDAEALQIIGQVIWGDRHYPR